MTGKLVAVGDNCLDVYLTKDAMTVGGNALNVAVHWRRAGFDARYVGTVGRDAEGDIIVDELAKAGLAPGDVERRAGHTAVTLLRERDGDRQILFEDLGVGKDYVPTDAQHRSIIAAADWVHLGTNADARLVRRLTADRIPFSIDLSTAHFGLPLQDVPVVFASGPDDPSAPVEPLIEKLQAAGAAQVVVTCGSRGAFCSDGGALLHVPAIPVSVVDTCGAGDSFIAGFLAARLDGRSEAAALQKGTADAAETCRYLGGFPQDPRRIPTWLLEKYAEVISPVERA